MAAQVHEVLHAFVPRNEDELALDIGDSVEVLEAPQGGWWRGRVEGKEHEGWFPCNHLAPPPLKPLSAASSGGSSTKLPAVTRHSREAVNSTPDVGADHDVGDDEGSPKPQARVVAVAAFAYSPLNQDELALAVGQKVIVLDQPEGGWWKGRAGLAEGWFPSNHVNVLNPEEYLEVESKAESKTNGGAHLRESGVLQHFKKSGVAGEDEAAEPHSPQSPGKSSPSSSSSSSKDDRARRAKSEPHHFHPHSPIAAQAAEPPASSQAQQQKVAAKPKQKTPPQPSQQPQQTQQQQPPRGTGSGPSSPSGSASRHSSVSSARSASFALARKKSSLTAMMRSRRTELNGEIAKELRVRDGAANLLKALLGKSKKDRAAREEAKITLSFCNARIQSLRLELQQLNGKQHAAVRRSVWLQHRSSQEAQQSDFDSLQDQCDSGIPIIALPFKETDHIDMQSAFVKVLEDTYHEKPEKFEAALERVQDLRDFVEEHLRIDESLDMHAAYYRQLAWLDNRFFTNHKHEDITFTWYDCCNGQPAAQQSLALERACVLFNTAVLCSHMAAAEDLNTEEGRQRACVMFKQAAGVFHFITENFLHAPSPDLSPPALLMFKGICLAQAQECMVWNLQEDKPDLSAGEWATLAEMYKSLHDQLSSDLLKNYVPPTWIHLAEAKTLIYEAAADRCTSDEQLQSVTKGCRNTRIATWTGIARLIRAQKGCEKAERLCGFSLVDMPAVASMLNQEKARIEKRLEGLNTDILYEQDHDLAKMLSCKGSSSKLAYATMPPQLEEPCDELFHDLGPIHVFNTSAKLQPVQHCVIESDGQGYGFTLGGTTPVCVFEVVAGGPAHTAGLKRGAVVVEVNGQNVRHEPHDVVVQMMRECRGRIDLAVQVVSEDSFEAFLQEEDAKAAQAAGTGAGGSASRRNSKQQVPPASDAVSVGGSDTGSGFGFGTNAFSLTGKRSTGSRRTSQAAAEPAPSADNSMLDSLALPNGAHFLGQEGRTFTNPLYNLKTK